MSFLQLPSYKPKPRAAAHDVSIISYEYQATGSRASIIIMSDDEPNALCDELLVGFSARRRPSSVRFISSVSVNPVRSTLTMICHQDELWYSRRDVETMKMQRTADAITLRRTLLASAEDLGEGGAHASEVIGLEKVINPSKAESK